MSLVHQPASRDNYLGQLPKLATYPNQPALFGSTRLFCSCNTQVYQTLNTMLQGYQTLSTKRQSTASAVTTKSSYAADQCATSRVAFRFQRTNPFSSCTAHYNTLLNLAQRSPEVAQIRWARSKGRRGVWRDWYKGDLLSVENWSRAGAHEMRIGSPEFWFEWQLRNIQFPNSHLGLYIFPLWLFPFGDSVPLENCPSRKRVHNNWSDITID